MDAAQATQPKEAVSYEMLQDLLRAERRSNKVIPLPPRFWHQAREMLRERLEAFRAEQAKDPFGRKVMALTDEVKNAKQTAESLWALRERKLAMLALATSKDRRLPEGVTADEGQLYQKLQEVLDEARGRTFEGTFPVEAQAPAPPPRQAPHAAASRPAAMGPAAAQPAPPATAVPAPVAAPARVPSDVAGGADLVTIRALGDIPPFVGPDMQTYLLKAGDVATVPKSIANLLVKRAKAAIVQEGASDK